MDWISIYFDVCHLTNPIYEFKSAKQNRHDVARWVRVTEPNKISQYD